MIVDKSTLVVKDGVVVTFVSEILESEGYLVRKPGSGCKEKVQAPFRVCRILADVDADRIVHAYD